MLHRVIPRTTHVSASQISTIDFLTKPEPATKALQRYPGGLPSTVDRRGKMNYQTIFSIFLWSCTVAYFITTSTLSKISTSTQNEANKADTTTSLGRRSRRSLVCTCAACGKQNPVLMAPTRIPYGRARKVLTFLKMARRGLQFTYRRRGLMYCKNGYILRITKNGSVGGTTRYKDAYSKLEFQSVGMGLIVIKGLISGRYLAINEQGAVYSTKLYSKDCVFEERQEENFYHSFVSHRYRKVGWYVALRRTGHVKKTTVLQKATQFLVLFS